MCRLDVLFAVLLMSAIIAVAQDRSEQKFDHVLLISVDGLHALDVANFVESHHNSALADLSRHGITYSNARTPSNSDSFPGLLALVTGGSPVSHGLFYDVSYDRTIFDPTNAACSGSPGNTMTFDESIDRYTSANLSLDVIDPAKLPRHLDSRGRCVPLYPHDAIRTNTIFEVVKAAGGRTALADKHPAYDLVNGPSGKGVLASGTEGCWPIVWRDRKGSLQRGRPLSQTARSFHTPARTKTKLISSSDFVQLRFRPVPNPFLSECN
jgi:hypothetical protein